MREVEVKVSTVTTVKVIASGDDDAMDRAETKILAGCPVPPDEITCEVTNIGDFYPADVQCIPVYVHSNPHLRGCAKGGITESNDELLLECEKGHVRTRPDDPRLLHVVERVIAGKVYTHAVQNVRPKDGRVVGPMFGGNFIYSSDGRFPCSYPIPVHDRFETEAEYIALC